jgi:hypothetical protein
VALASMAGSWNYIYGQFNINYRKNDVKSQQMEDTTKEKTTVLQPIHVDRTEEGI